MPAVRTPKALQELQELQGGDSWNIGAGKKSSGITVLFNDETAACVIIVFAKL
jgi:hypothetical protein